MSLDPFFETLRSFFASPMRAIDRLRSRRRRCLRLALLMAATGWSGFASNGFGQDAPASGGAANGDFVIQAQAEYYEEETGTRKGKRKYEAPQPTGNGSDAEEGIGTMFRADHLFGNTVGRTTGLTPLEVVPYRLFDNDMWFGSVRFSPNDKGRLAGSSGLGYRYFEDTIARVFGASLWYDLDDSSRTTFQQFGVSFETYGESWDSRSNIYVPFGDTSDLLTSFVNPGSTRYSGHSILFDRTTVSVTAMPGHDGEIGIPIQGEFGDKHDIRAYAGYYHYFRSDVPEIWGWRTRIEAHIIPQVEVQVQGSGDDVYGTNLMVGVAWLFSGGMFDKPEQARKSAYGRMGEWVRRNYNVVAPEQRIVDAGLRAVNPTTGNDYVVQHVDTNSGNSDGSFEDPFHTVAQAQAAGAEIIVVRSGSVLSGSDASIVLQDGQTLLGDAAGVEHWIPTSQFANFLMPHASNGTALPTMLNATGNAVTLASNSTLAGFRIEGSTGSGIFADGITNAIVRDVDIVNAGANGIDLHNVHGNLDFVRTHVDGANATVVNPLLTNSSGLRIEGGDAEVKFDGTIENSAGNQVAVIGTTGGHVDLTKAMIQSNVGGGVAVRDAAGDVTFKDVTLSNTIGDGISVQGGNGTVRFLGQTSLTSVFGKGVKIDGLPDGGLVKFDNLWMDQRQDVGIDLNNIGGSVQFLGNTVIQAGNGITTAGIDFQNSSGAVTFNNVDLVGGGTGIHMGSLLNENTGSFQVNGTTNISSVSGPGIHIYDDSASVLFNQVEIANRQAEGILIDGGRGFVQFKDTVGISNGLGSTAAGIVVENSTGNIRFEEANINNATGTGGVRIEDNSGSTLFENLNINSQNGVGLFARNGGNLYVYDGNVQTTGASAVDLESTNLSAEFTTVSSSGGNVGMRFKETTGSFVVTGNGTVNSGGTIQGADRGIVIEESTGISLQDMLVYNNRVGIDADDAGTLLFNRFNINNSTEDAIQATNTANLTVANSVIWNNSSAGSSSVVLDYDEVGSYLLTFTGNSTTSQNKDAFTILGNSGSEGSTLGMTIGNNLFQTDRNGDSGIDMTWRGATTGSIASNTFQGDDGSNVGISVNSMSTTQNLNLSIGQNRFTFAGGNDAAVRLHAAGTSQLNFAQNQVDLHGVNSQGFVFDLTTTNAVFGNNAINGYHDVTHGILFNTISAPSQVSFNGNTMGFASVNSLIHQGITFGTVNNVTSTDKITLSGSRNNSISGASNNFIAPAGSTTGQFLLNNVFGP